jgi:hypothetical protein
MKVATTAWPRWVNAILGAWVVVSTLLWSPATSTTINGVVIGALIVAASVFALRAVDAIFAVWLFVATWILPHSEALLLSDILTSLSIILVAVAFRMSQKRMAVVTEWPDIPTTHEHEPFVAMPGDLVDDRSHEGRGTMW